MSYLSQDLHTSVNEVILETFTKYNICTRLFTQLGEIKDLVPIRLIYIQEREDR